MSQAVVFGEILFDVFADGECLGGAPLNCGWYLRQFGIDVQMVSAMGNDQRGEQAKKLMQEAGIHLELVGRRDEPTGYVTVELSNGEPNYTIHEGVAWDHIELDSSEAPKADLLYFGSLAQRTEVNRDALKCLLGNGTKHRLFDVNLRQHYYSEEILRDGLEAASLLKCNHEEWEVIKKVACIDRPVELAERFGIQAIVITMGANGAELHLGDQTMQAQSKASKVADTVGAGDAVAAVLGAALVKGRDLREALSSAMEVGAFVVGQRGAQAELPEELKAR